MAKFKLTPKHNPRQMGDRKMWHAIPAVVNRLDTRTLCKVVTRHTTTAPTEAESTFNLVCDGIVHELQQGNSVQLGELGWLRLSFSSDGVERPEDFDAAHMIRDVKIIFTPSRTLMGEVTNGLTFESVGLAADGFTFANVRAYREYQKLGGIPVPPAPGNGATSSGTASATTDATGQPQD